MSDPLVTVTSYWYPGDAALARSALTAAGIESVLEGQYTAATNWLGATGMRGVRLRVRNEDALRAAEVLGTECASLGEIEEADEPPVDPTVCRACGTPGAIRSQRALSCAAIAALGRGIGGATGSADAAFFGVIAAGVYLLIADRWRCAECGASWN